MAITQQLQRSARPYGTRSPATSQPPTGRPATLWGRGERPFGRGIAPAVVYGKRSDGGAMVEPSPEYEYLLARTARLRTGCLAYTVEQREE